MSRLNEVIDSCEIDFKRNRKRENERQILTIKSMMSKLTFHQNVARYAYLLDYEEYYSKKKDLTPEEENKRFEGQAMMLLLEDDINVQKYIELREDLLRLLDECRDYYRTINIGFREGLCKVDLPNIFVYQGELDGERHLKLSKHIILDKAQEAYYKTPNTVIYSMDGINSKREARHFYSTVSFKYLEQLSIDQDFDPKIKRLGRVRIEDGKKF